MATAPTSDGVDGDRRILRVGVIGCGELSQVVHIPTLNLLSDKFVTTYLCDVSKNALSHCAALSNSKTLKTTMEAEELCASDEVDVVLVANATAFHVPHALLALKHNKYCLLEKPAALTYRDVDALVAAESLSKGRIFVGYMRRYAAAFLEAVEEVGGLDNILHARVRDVIGPNSNFVHQSGTFPKTFKDIGQSDVDELNERNEEMVQHALQTEFGVQVTPTSTLMLQALAGLGSHDLSAMREIIGVPKSCIGASLRPIGFWTALLEYENFCVTYESGINNIPVFDAYIEILAQNKSVRVNFDTPYVKGLPITLTIREKIEGRPGSGSNGYQERVIRRTYEDAYTLEWQSFYECVVYKKEPKTSAKDAREDIDIYAMILRAGEKQHSK